MIENEWTDVTMEEWWSLVEQIMCRRRGGSVDKVHTKVLSHLPSFFRHRRH